MLRRDSADSMDGLVVLSFQRLPDSSCDPWDTVGNSPCNRQRTGDIRHEAQGTKDSGTRVWLPFARPSERCPLGTPAFFMHEKQRWPESGEEYGNERNPLNCLPFSRHLSLARLWLWRRSACATNRLFGLSFYPGLIGPIRQRMTSPATSQPHISAPSPLTRHTAILRAPSISLFFVMTMARP